MQDTVTVPFCSADVHWSTCWIWVVWFWAKRFLHV